MQDVLEFTEGWILAYIIQPMHVEDIPRVMEIEHESFSMWWSERSYRRELEENKMAHYITVREEQEGQESKETGPIIGYTGMWVMLDEAHITAIAVVPEYRGKGIGELLLMVMFELARDIGAEFVTLEVRASNEVAQKLYQKYGMSAVGVRKGYYTTEQEDAIIMTSESVNTREFALKLQALKKARIARLDQPVRVAGLQQSTILSASQ